MNAGRIEWMDLTVPDAERVRDFYQHAVGWQASPVRVGDHDDYTMTPAGENAPVAGICHAIGDNANMPAQWMLYISVPDLQASIDRCLERGGTLEHCHPSGSICVMRDPAGAVFGLYAPEQHP
jgi:hypothetical protein